MSYRSFTPLATRKSPAFRGTSIQLDGVGDYISLNADYESRKQGIDAGIFRHSVRHSTQLSTNANYAPQTWLFWVKFDLDTLTDVVTHTQQYGADMKHFIMKQHAAVIGYQNSGDQEYWVGPFVGLVADGSGNVKVAAGWGTNGIQTSTNRMIRRGSTTISANTWYQIVVTWEGKNSISHGKIFVNNNLETLAAHYPTGGSSEINVNNTNSALPFYYYVLNTSTFSDPTGDTFSAGEVLMHNQASETYDCCIGRNQNDFLAMTIMQCAFWGRTALDQDDVTGLYESTNPSGKQYHVNGEGAGSANVDYDKGEDVHATVVNINFNGTNGVGKPIETLTLTDMHGTAFTFLFTEYDGQGNNGISTSASSDGQIVVYHHDGSFPGNLDNNATCTNFANAVNTHTVLSGTEFKTISAVDNGGSVTLTMGYGGANGNTSISYSGTFAADFVRTGAAGAAPTAFEGGIDRLHGVWKFRGTKVSTSLDNTLQGTSNRFSEYNEDPQFTTQRIDVPSKGAQSNFNSLTGLPTNTLSAINNGGLYVNDTAPNTI